MKFLNTATNLIFYIVSALQYSQSQRGEIFHFVANRDRSIQSFQ
jgi:hypothetical protein